MEALFKATAKALDQATMLDERLAGKVLSTKGMLLGEIDLIEAYENGLVAIRRSAHSFWD